MFGSITLSFVCLEAVYAAASDQMLSLETEFGAGVADSDANRDLIAIVKTRTRKRKEALRGGGRNWQTRGSISCES